MDRSSKYCKVCVFCYKNIDSGKPSCSDDAQDNCLSQVQHFLNLLHRFTNEQIGGTPFTDFNMQGFTGCCENCLALIDKFCAEYHELKCLELQLEHKVGRLVNIMKLAGRVPSRVIQLRQAFELHQSPAVANTESSKLDGNSNTSLDAFVRFRKRLQKNCIGKLSKSQPRVILNRLGESRIGANISSSKGLDFDVEANAETFLAWIFSFAAVILLLEPGCHKISDLNEQHSTVGNYKTVTKISNNNAVFEQLNRDKYRIDNKDLADYKGDYPGKFCRQPKLKQEMGDYCDDTNHEVERMDMKKRTLMFEDSVRISPTMVRDSPVISIKVEWEGDPAQRKYNLRQRRSLINVNKKKDSDISLNLPRNQEEKENRANCKMEITDSTKSVISSASKINKSHILNHNAGFSMAKLLHSKAKKHQKKPSKIGPSFRVRKKQVRQCPICEKWVVKNNMSIHRRIHTGKKPYKCHICESRFTQNGSFNIHMRNVHKNQWEGLTAPTAPCKCFLCGREFKYSWNLKSHIIRTHNPSK